MIQPKLQKIEEWNEKIMLPVILLGPILSLPQLYYVWFESHQGVSVITWTAYFVTQIFWLIHAFKYKDGANILAGVLWLIIEFLIILGLFVR
jgi:hypothetical protein